MIEYTGPIYSARNKTWWAEAVITNDANKSSTVRVAASRNFFEDLGKRPLSDLEILVWFEHVFARWDQNPALYDQHLHLDVYLSDPAKVEEVQRKLQDGSL